MTGPDFTLQTYKGHTITAKRRDDGLWYWRILTTNHLKQTYVAAQGGLNITMAYAIEEAQEYVDRELPDRTYTSNAA